MKNFMKLLSVALFVAMGAVMTSCSNDDDDNTSDFVDPYKTAWEGKTAKYTIMFYGCGGGDVDGQLTDAIPYLMQCLKEKGNQVRFVVMYSMSKNDSRYRQEEKTNKPINPDYGEWGNTYRYEVTPYLTKENYENGFYKKASEVKLYEVETIKEFINWAKKTAPAENYILMPTNHGGGYDLDMEELAETTRAIGYDDNHAQKGIPTKAFAQALKETNTHLKAIYWNGCLMGQLEVMTEMAPYCDYQFCGAHVQYALPRHAYGIVDALNEHPDNFEDAARRQRDILDGPLVEGNPSFSDVLISEKTAENTLLDSNGDYGCWRCAGLAAINAQVKRLADVVTKGYADDDTRAMINKATSSVYMFTKDDPYVDVLDYACHIHNNLITDETLDIYSSLAKAFSEAAVYQIGCMNRKIVDVNGETVLNKWPATNRYSLGISIYECTNKTWIEYNSVYKASAFDKATGWSKFLDMNLQELNSNINPANDSSIVPFWMD